MSPGDPGKSSHLEPPRRSVPCQSCFSHFCLVHHTVTIRTPWPSATPDSLSPTPCHRSETGRGTGEGERQELTCRLLHAEGGRHTDSITSDPGSQLVAPLIPRLRIRVSKTDFPDAELRVWISSLCTLERNTIQQYQRLICISI